MHLRQSTASQSIVIGPFVDDTDGKTLETGLTIANTDIKLCKNGAASVNKNSGGGTHRVNGMYSVTLDATDTDTVGKLQISVLMSGALVVYHEVEVIEEAVYDALYASGATGYLQPTTAGRTLDVTVGGCAGIDWANVEAPTTTVDLSNTSINLCDTVTTNTDMRGTDNALLAASAPTNFGDLSITATTGRVAVGTNNDKTGYSISGTKTTLDALNDIAATAIVSGGAITTSDGAVSNVTTVATCTTNTDMRGTDGANTTTPPTAAAIADQVWDEVLSGHLTAGSTGNALNAAGSAGDPWSTSIPGAYGAGSAGYILGNNLDAAISTRSSQTSVDTVDGIVDSIFAALPTNFGDLAITATTGLVSVGTNNDKAGYAISGTITTLDALDTAQDTQHSTTQSAISALNDLDAAGVRSAVGLASANLDTQLTAIVTDTAEIGAAGAGLTAIPWNASWDAEVQSECTDALNAYDPSTNAEMLAAFAALNDISVTDILTTQMTESYAADGTAPTLAQALFMIQQELGEFSVSGTTITVKRLDGSTTAATFTLDDGTSPTSKTRTT